LLLYFRKSVACLNITIFGDTVGHTTINAMTFIQCEEGVASFRSLLTRQFQAVM